MIDGHFLYREPVKIKALKRLEANPDDIEAHWSLAVIAVLGNRPADAETSFAELQRLLPNNFWPSAYRSIVCLASWDIWTAAEISNKATEKWPNDTILAISDLSSVMGGAFWRIPSFIQSVPKAIQTIEKSLEEVDQLHGSS